MPSKCSRIAIRRFGSMRTNDFSLHDRYRLFFFNFKTIPCHWRDSLLSHYVSKVAKEKTDFHFNVWYKLSTNSEYFLNFITIWCQPLCDSLLSHYVCIIEIQRKTDFHFNLKQIEHKLRLKSKSRSKDLKTASKSCNRRRESFVSIEQSICKIPRVCFAWNKIVRGRAKVEKEKKRNKGETGVRCHVSGPGQNDLAAGKSHRRFIVSSRTPELNSSSSFLRRATNIARVHVSRLETHAKRLQFPRRPFRITCHWISFHRSSTAEARSSISSIPRFARRWRASRSQRKLFNRDARTRKWDPETVGSVECSPSGN